MSTDSIPRGAPTDPTRTDAVQTLPTQAGPDDATTVPSSAIGLSALRAVVDGRLTTPGDDGWDAARSPWVVNVDQHPLAVLEVSGPADVAVAVRWASENGVPVTAQPLGHGATSALEGVLLLRTRALASIDVDARSRTARVGAGVKVGELLAALQGSGLTFLAGSSPDPTVVGICLAGGMSWFGRAWGLTANDVVAVELVDPFGDAVRVTRASDPDLFWALRGGGGDFGIVTAIEIALHPAPSLYGGRLLWPVDRMGDVLRAFRRVSETAPPELTMWAHVYQFPPIPEVPEPIRGKSFASVAIAYLGSAAEAERLLAPFRSLGEPAMDLMGPVAMCDLGGIADEPLDPTPILEHSLLLDDLDDDAIDGLVAAAGEGSGSALAVLQVRHLGAGFAAAHSGNGAAGHVEEPYLLFALGILAAPGLAEPIRGTFAAIDTALVGHTSGRTVPNFLGAQGDPVRARSSSTIDRLRAIKTGRDPHRTIRSNRPVLGRSPAGVLTRSRFLRPKQAPAAASGE